MHPSLWSISQLTENPSKEGYIFSSSSNWLLTARYTDIPFDLLHLLLRFVFKAFKMNFLDCQFHLALLVILFFGRCFEHDIQKALYKQIIKNKAQPQPLCFEGIAIK